MLPLIGAVLMLGACSDRTAPEGLAPDTGVRQHLNPADTIVVWPGALGGWWFMNDDTGRACTDAARCRFVTGPGTPLAGAGSAELAATATADASLALDDYAGVRLDRITALRYSTYRQSADPASNAAITLQLNVDYDLADARTKDQGRLVYQPSLNRPGGVAQGLWQTWDARVGLWWGTDRRVPARRGTVANVCVEAAPCTWSQLLARFPNIGIHAQGGGVVLKALNGEVFRGNVDNLVIGVDGSSTTFDFEMKAASTVAALPPDSLPVDYRDTTRAVSGGSHMAGMILPDIVVLGFRRGTPQQDRASAISSVNGVVVGGRRRPDGDGLYLVRVPTDGTIEPLFQAIARLRLLPQVSTATPEVIFSDLPTYRRPNDGSGERKADWRLESDSASGDTGRRSWALEAASAPFAWGCSTGGDVRVGIIDMGLHADGDIRPNIDTTNVLPPSIVFTHGTRVASVLAARGDDNSGITGMMWHARLDLRDVAAMANGSPVLYNGSQISSSSALQIAAQSVAMRNVRVVNISLGSNTPQAGPRTLAPKWQQPTVRDVPPTPGEIKAATFPGIAHELFLLHGPSVGGLYGDQTVELRAVNTVTRRTRALTSFFLDSPNAAMSLSEDGKELIVISRGPSPDYLNCWVDFRSTTDGRLLRRVVSGIPSSHCEGSVGGRSTTRIAAPLPLR